MWKMTPRNQVSSRKGMAWYVVFRGRTPRVCDLRFPRLLIPQLPIRRASTCGVPFLLRESRINWIRCWLGP
ncbi:hypothetical protein PVAP13_1KG201600 [Panicum virgatum]|uniref:Uncharacterized protein n=1 Tax=Panicum virgatum TaxID=38727 RepID=A0A8T0X7J4_PANVG|nr:hypothetical protein PVAP13_1KG201600 [Panicum virgatum]